MEDFGALNHDSRRTLGVCPQGGAVGVCGWFTNKSSPPMNGSINSDDAIDPSATRTLGRVHTPVSE
jgi:hypothetical protein